MKLDFFKEINNENIFNNLNLIEEKKEIIDNIFKNLKNILRNKYRFQNNDFSFLNSNNNEEFLEIRKNPRSIFSKYKFEENSLQNFLNIRKEKEKLKNLFKFLFCNIFFSPVFEYFYSDFNSLERKFFYSEIKKILKFQIPLDILLCLREIVLDLNEDITLIDEDIKDLLEELGDEEIQKMNLTKELLFILKTKNNFSYRNNYVSYYLSKENRKKQREAVIEIVESDPAILDRILLGKDIIFYIDRNLEEDEYKILIKEISKAFNRIMKNSKSVKLFEKITNNALYFINKKELELNIDILSDNVKNLYLRYLLNK